MSSLRSEYLAPDLCPEDLDDTILVNRNEMSIPITLPIKLMIRDQYLNADDSFQTE